MIKRLSGTANTEEGASLVLIAVSMMLLIGMAALAVDLGALRSDIRSDRLAADAAVAAGASSINPFTGSDAEAACETAWAYLLLNLEDEGSATAPDCTVFSTACNPGTARQATATAGPYAFVITHPVPDGDPLMGSQALNSQIDGVSCQRLGVSVHRTRDAWFAGMLGSSSNSTNVSAVARINPDVGEGDVVPLVLLEPRGCDALTADGQGKITVTHFNDSPGFIVVDSDGSGSDCNPSSPYIIETQAVGDKRWIRAIPTPSGIPSAILSYALSGDPGADPSRAYSPADLTTAVVGADPADPPESFFQLYPQPGPRSDRVTRAPIDWRYNCKGGYPPYLGISIDPCPTTPATHIDDLIVAYGSPVGVSPMGSFQTWTDTHSCTIGAGTLSVSGNWWVNCSDFIVNGATVIFDDGDVVFDGTVDIRSDGILEVNPSPVDEFDNHTVFIRDGDLKNGAQTRVSMTQTFVYLENGVIDLVGETVLEWTAPKLGIFEDLALWSESPDQHELGGQGGNTLTGTFFTPYADPFVLKGQAGQLQTDAQFLTRRLVVTGFTEVLMKPDPETSTLIPIRGVKLIR